MIETFYNILEVSVMMFFLSMYFKPKPKLSALADFSISFAAIFALEIILGMAELHWIVTLVIVSSLTIALTLYFYKGAVTERIIVPFVCVFLLALSDVCSFTLIGRLLDRDYNELVKTSDYFRMLAVLSSKAFYLVVVSVILFFKKRYRLFLSRREFILILTTLILSGIQVALIRNIIYTSETYYKTFLIILLCVVVMNIIIYYTMIYIGKKNIDEKRFSLIQKQLELQEESIQNLEQKYDETAKIRHDIKNYISCALDMAEKGDHAELTKYLEELSDEKINAITSYVATKRRVMGAVLNSKLSKAKAIGADMQCYILSELENVSDMDIGIILANLLDNALEACEKNQGHSEILLKTWSEAGYHFIEISNTVENNVLIENPKLKTNKANSDLHGVGLRSVKDLVEKYNGMIGFDQKGNTFRVCVSLARD